MNINQENEDKKLKKRFQEIIKANENKKLEKNSLETQISLKGEDLRKKMLEFGISSIEEITQTEEELKKQLNYELDKAEKILGISSEYEKSDVFIKKYFE